MKLVTKEVADALPELYATEETPTMEKLIVAKWFLTESAWTWYAVEGSPVDGAGEVEELLRQHSYDLCDWLMFGFVVGHECEWGYWRMSELRSIRSPQLGLPVERDKFWTPTTFRDLLADGTTTIAPVDRARLLARSS